MKNKRNPKSGCFSAVLRRLLCSGDPQTHPSDQISDLYQPDFVLEEQKEHFSADPSAAPGIVARLMGLDSLPEKIFVPDDPARVSRSKSVNFIDYLLEFDLTEAKHRRFRTSVSFREVPSRQLQEKQAQELLLIYLENDAGKQSTPELLKHRKCEKEKVLKKEEKKNKKISKLKDEPRRRRKISIEKMEKRKEEISRFGRRKRKDILFRKAESHQNSADNLRHKKSNSKKKWSPKSRNSDSFPNEDLDSDKIVKNETEVFMESLEHLSKLTEEDIKGANWASEMAELKLEDLEEICVELGGQIMELMLDQVADELLGIW